MQKLIDLLNKIKWDKRENPDDYALYYLDRITNEYKEIKFNYIKEIEGSFIVLNDEDETHIPLHRFKIVKKNGLVVWRRD